MPARGRIGDRGVLASARNRRLRASRSPIRHKGRIGIDDSLSWTVRPFDGQPLKRLIVFAVAFLAMGVGWFGFGRPLFGILGFAMILGSTAEYWLGASFRLDAKGASARTGPSVTAMEWKDVRRVLVKGSEVRLSPLEAPSGLDAFRGVGLVVTPENREAVMAYVAAHVPE